MRFFYSFGIEYITDDLTGTKRLDSILFELRRFNNNLKKLKEDK